MNKLLLLLCLTCVWFVLVTLLFIAHRHFYSNSPEAPVHIIIMTKQRSHNKFEYLHRAISGVATNLMSKMLVVPPLVTIYHTHEHNFDSVQYLDVFYKAANTFSALLLKNLKIIHIDTAKHFELFNEATAANLSPEHRRRANDVINMFENILSNTCKDKPQSFVIITEDEFEWCKGSLHHLTFIMDKIESISWKGVRLSFGLNGLLLKCSTIEEIVGIIKIYLKTKTANTQIDSIIEQVLFQGEDVEYQGPPKNFNKLNQFYIYRFNLMKQLEKLQDPIQCAMIFWQLTRYNSCLT